MKSTSLPYSTYLDRIHAGWIGKSFGGVIGAPLECQKEFKTIDPEKMWPDKLAANDDLDLQVLWLEAMQERGLWLTSRDLADFWQDRCWYFFCEYGVFLNNIQRGIAPPLSGTWNNAYFEGGEGCPIRAEIWGYVAAGNPALAAELARIDGQLDHGEISIQAEQFLAAAAASAVVHADFEAALEAGLSVVPEASPIARSVERVRHLAQHYTEPKQAWRAVVREFGSRNANCAIINHALTLLALFQGGLDMKRTMHLCTMFGFDTDCTASTAGALLGTLSGTAGLPQDWVKMLGPTLLCGIAVKHKDTPLADFAADTARIGVEMALAGRNDAISFSGAPEVTVRPRPEHARLPEPAPAKGKGRAKQSRSPKSKEPQRVGAEYATDSCHVTMDVEYLGNAKYPGQPVLWALDPTQVQITLRNPTETGQGGTFYVHFAHDSSLNADLVDGYGGAGGRIHSATTDRSSRGEPGYVPAGETASWVVELSRKDPYGEEWIPDKNLFEVEWRPSPAAADDDDEQEEDNPFLAQFSGILGKSDMDKLRGQGRAVQDIFSNIMSRLKEAPSSDGPCPGEAIGIMQGDSVGSMKLAIGLAGARQWQVYGPYWDMWDKTKNAECPYNNATHGGGPSTVTLPGDCYNQYARLDSEYLDEARLLREDLPDEAPMALQTGEDTLRSRDFGGFEGQAVYYLVRTFRGDESTDAAGPEGEEIALQIGRSGPYRAWLDGVEIGSSNEMRSWSMMDDVWLKTRVTTKPKRLVIKLVRLTDDFTFSLYFMSQRGKDYKRGVSNIADFLQDQAPSAEQMMQM